MRKAFIASVAAAFMLAVAHPPGAHAQMAVIDLKAIGQAEQQVQNQLTAINNQLLAIQHLESQLSNQALMLQKMETDVTGPILGIEAQATQILQNAQGIGYGAQNVAQSFSNLYPSSFPAGASLATTQQSLATWRTNNTQAIQAALQLQNQIAQGQPTTTSQVKTAVAASQGASGQTGAIQAGNQLLATVTAQLTQLQNLLITQQRAEQLLAAQAQGSQATGAADSQRYWNITAPASRVQNAGTL
jgi:type IV secretion system protein TrbJ